SVPLTLCHSRESGNPALGDDEPARRRECDACHTGKQQRIFSILAAPGENPSQKHLRIQQFARLSKMNSLCDGTGNQFDHNREFNSRQQRINSTQQGIGAKSIFAPRLE
ncbi:MAG: hypothetical protein WAL59_27945, partial [Roseiarcus sp.]